MTAPALGALAPDFSLPSSAGGRFSLAAARGAPVVLYFYPRDSTPGCTLEAQEFQALLPAFRRLKARVCGISRDSLDSHSKFCERHGLRFELLADEDGAVCRRFDVIHEKNMYGRKLLGIVRSTFLVDAAGKLRREWRKVKVAGHAAEVLEAVKAL
jgi:thioredoxin-dependent peroxiredoxin